MLNFPKQYLSKPPIAPEFPATNAQEPHTEMKLIFCALVLKLSCSSSLNIDSTQYLLFHFSLKGSSSGVYEKVYYRFAVRNYLILCEHPL